MTKPIAIRADPTKQFFVRMLTRDIELLDAILDLIDNCIDGVIRSDKSKKNTKSSKPYDGFYAKITANNKKFVIEDNCGGIPQKIAENVAFRMGRPSDEELVGSGVKIEKQGTVGVYGIGMKRAIFKMGEHAVVATEHGDTAFKVEITQEWMKSSSWDLEMNEVPVTGTKGTRIEVTKLREEIARDFSQDANFLEDLYRNASELFTIIIEKGFLILINGVKVNPVSLSLLVTTGANGSASVSPYVFKGKIGQVSIEIVVGFYREPYKLPESDDIDDPRNEVRQAGWSVVCNDRLVLYGDKTHMTGWGLKPIPRFHNQYNAIAGTVTLRSDDPELLPLNTTKHKIEVNFGVYYRIVEWMKDGVRPFIDFTNEWKGRLPDTAPQFKNAKPMPVADIPQKLLEEKHKKVPAGRLGDSGAEATERSSNLPAPPRDTGSQQIRFTKSTAEISEVGRAILGDESAKPSDVGEECFNQVLRDIRAKAKKKT
ncbi:ATP-binding protein [Zavarzinella formosa]|uniref:ATP-binding protein n=1 Tax=Zavarzinella formosa TaxID=360055 RepID=UPI0003777F2B|nr:ATP-binding protein [Zavarzinella formosa]